MPSPEVCAININVMVLTTLGNVSIRAGARIAPVVLLICKISSIRHADSEKQEDQQKAMHRGYTVNTPKLVNIL